MFKAVIFSKVHKRTFTSTFMTKDKADKWVDDHPLVQKLDPKEYTIDVFEMLPDGSKKPEEPPPIVDPWEKIRAERNRILCATDWLFLPDVNIEPKFRKMFMVYRKYLRDITNSNTVPKIEAFDHWLRRNHPEEFMDGGKHKQILKLFKAYL
jgi:hypothetical protein